jgi:tetratricopeptide (TPR) repeat protein
MLDKEMTIMEVKKELEGKGDFVQIDQLTRLLKEKVRPEVRRFIHQRLGEIYESKGMLIDAARMYNNVAISAMSFVDKKSFHLKEAELYIMAGKFEEVDEALKKAMHDANAPERAEIFITIKEFYRKQAEIFEFNRKKNHAAKIYEKLLAMDISNIEKKELKARLLGLYENLGMIKEYMALKREGETQI